MLQVRQALMFQVAIRILQGALIGLGAVLPGVSGGVLCVVFGLYKPIIEFLANPLCGFKAYVRILLPVTLGGLAGFLGVAHVLSFFLEKYPGPSVCLFVGLIAGMLPSLFQEAGRHGRSVISGAVLLIAMAAVFVLLAALRVLQMEFAPGFGVYLFCGCCLALSIIAPGLSFSTLLMPLGLYKPFVNGIGSLNPQVLVPGGIGAAATILLLSRAVNALFERHHSVVHHAVIGVVIAATMEIIPFPAFSGSGAGFWVHALCIAFGFVAALMLDEFNRRHAQ